METIEDIVRELREGVRDVHGNRIGIYDDLADRIEAAYKSKEEYALFVQPFKGSPWCIDSNALHSLETARNLAECRGKFDYYRIQIKKRNVTEWTLVEEVKND